MKIDIALQRDGTCVEVTFGDNDGTATCLVACEDSQVDGFMIEFVRIIGNGSKVGDKERAIRELCTFDVLHDLLCLLECFLHCLREGTAYGQEHGK